MIHNYLYDLAVYKRWKLKINLLQFYINNWIAFKIFFLKKKEKVGVSIYKVVQNNCQL